MQTMLKHTARILLDEEGGLSPEDWCLTDHEFVHQRSLRHPRAAEVVKRMRLGDTYLPLAIFWAEGDGVTSTVVNSLPAIEAIASEVFDTMNVVTNYMIDKRERGFLRPLIFFGKESAREQIVPKEALLLGFFTPSKQKAPDRSAVDDLIYRLRGEVFHTSCLSHVHVRKDTRPRLVVERCTETNQTPTLFDMIDRDEG